MKQVRSSKVLKGLRKAKLKLRNALLRVSMIDTTDCGETSSKGTYQLWVLESLRLGAGQVKQFY